MGQLNAHRVRVWVRVWFRVWVRVRVGLALELGLGLSGRSRNSDRELLGSGNSNQKPRNYQHCCYQHLWVVIPKVGNSDDW